MGRHRKTNTDLPMRLFEHYGAYRYVTSRKGRQTVTPLGRNRQKAIRIADELNRLSRIERNETVGRARSITGIVRERILARDDYQCVYCGARQDLILDHFIPYSKGGATHPDNLVTCCVSCNDSKGDQSPIEFLAIVGGIRTKIIEAILTDLFPLNRDIP